MKQPLLWAAVGVVVLGALIWGATRDRNDSTELSNPAVTTTTVADVTDGRPTPSRQDLTNEVGDIDDQPHAPGYTETVRDADTARPGVQLGAQPIVDELERCLWLVDIPGENPAKLFIAAWPEGTEITWEPFRAQLPDQAVLTETGARVAGDAIVVDTVGQLASPEVERLLGMETCEHDGIVVFGDSPDAVTLQPTG